MALWTCPNKKCSFNDQLKLGSLCPLCGAEAKGFDFEEFGDLLKSKDESRKAEAREVRRETGLGHTKYCPKCGSPNLNFLIYFRPSIWKCLDCNYEGTFVVEGEELAAKIREHYQKNSVNK